MNTGENMQPNKISQLIGHFSQLLKTDLLAETRVSEYLFKFSNTNSRINCKICSKLTTEASDVILVSLLLTLNIFDVLFQCFLADFKHLNARWNT